MIHIDSKTEGLVFFLIICNDGPLTIVRSDMSARKSAALLRRTEVFRPAI
jgi:hypothetical protein